MTAPFGPRAHFAVADTLADGTVVYGVTVQHFAAPAPCVSDDDDDGGLPPAPEPLVHIIGLVWERVPYGWCASPPAADWSQAVQQAVRSFPDRDSAAQFLYGWDAAVRYQKYQEALAVMPRPRNS